MHRHGGCRWGRGKSPKPAKVRTTKNGEEEAPKVPRSRTSSFCDRLQGKMGKGGTGMGNNGVRTTTPGRQSENDEETQGDGVSNSAASSSRAGPQRKQAGGRGAEGGWKGSPHSLSHPRVWDVRSASVAQPRFGMVRRNSLVRNPDSGCSHLAVAKVPWCPPCVRRGPSVCVRFH
jgi:hypothetical protein